MNPGPEYNRQVHREEESNRVPVTRFSKAIGRSRFVVLLAVVAVMLVALSLFLLGTIQAVVGIWDAWSEVAVGHIRSTELTVEFLEIVSVMLKAVFFYIIGVGLYSLFVSPLNITLALGVETLNDLEAKVISIVVVILSVTFLEHFILWQEPLETLQFGGALALVVAALVFFQRHARTSAEEETKYSPEEKARAQYALFHDDREEHDIEADTTNDAEGHAHARGTHIPVSRSGKRPSETD